MIGRFNKETIDLVTTIERDVATKLKVKDSTLCFAFGENAINHKCEICFETDEEDTYSSLTINSHNRDIKEIISDWMCNPRVKWFKQASEL